MTRQKTLSTKIEITYLATLRIVILIVATLIVGLTIYLVGDGGRKFATSTEVAPKPVSVDTQQVLAAVAAQKKAAEADGTPTSAPDGEAQKFKAFLASGNFNSYYSSYTALARRFNKPEDGILTRDAFAAYLGYTVDAYRAGEDDTVRRFVDDAAYSAQLISVAALLTGDNRVASQLRQYQTAQKTAQSCSTAYEPRRVWDSSSTSCDGWWQSPVGCSVIREMPVQKCVAAYPAGITSPLDAFTQMDRGFRVLWAAQAEKSQNDAAAERAKREATKADAIPTLMRAAYVFGAFLFIMFLFLVVAIERHLRGLATAAKEQGIGPGAVHLRAAE